MAWGGYRHSQFKAQRTSLKDAVLITPFSVDDKRGNFTKDFFRSFFKANNLDYDLSETFYAKNVKSNTLRGMHFATKNPQAKIVKCITGEIYDVIVDMRKDSPTYLKWEGFYLSEENNLSLYVPKGFAHGYLTIKPGIVSYKCCGDYDPKYDTGIKYDDPTFDIKWPISSKNDIIISDKDNHLKTYLEMKDIIEY